MIYQLNDQIERLLEDMTDPDTGELKKYILGHDGEPREVPLEEQLDAEASGVPLPYLDSEKMLMEKLEQLQLDYAVLIRNLRNDYFNRKAEADALKAEKQRLAKRQATAERAYDRAARFLAYLTKGEKYQDEDVKISYRKSETVELDDDFLDWAMSNAPGLVKVTPEPRKADIKRMLKNGQQIEHAHLETRQNIQIK
jgi:hypothetical protein